MLVYFVVLMSQKTILSILSDRRDIHGKPYDAEKMRQYAKRFEEREITYEGLRKLMRTSDGKLVCGTSSNRWKGWQ